MCMEAEYVLPCSPYRAPGCCRRLRVRAADGQASGRQGRQVQFIDALHQN